MTKEQIKIGMKVNALFGDGVERNGVVVSKDLHFVAVKCDSGEVFHTAAIMCDEITEQNVETTCVTL